MENLPPPEESSAEAAVDRDNSTHDQFENVANPLRPGAEDEAGKPGQDGRNLRAFGSTDQDGANGVLRMNDQDNSTMEVTPEAEKSVVGSDQQTNTSTVSVTTAGPDDDASADETPVPAAEKEAKEAVATGKTADDAKPESDEETDDSIAQTGTDLNFKPTT